MTLPFGVGQSVNAFSDHYPFMLAGVPTGGMEQVKSTRTGRGYGHTRYDTLDKADITLLREAAVLAARLAVRVASEEDWPVARRSREAVTAVQTRIKETDWKEEARQGTVRGLQWLSQQLAHLADRFSPAEKPGKQ